MSEFAFAPTARLGRFLTLSNTAATDSGGRFIGGSLREQTQLVLDALDRRAQAAGTDLSRAVAVHVYLRNASDFAAMNEVYAPRWKDAPPTRTTIVCGLDHPDALVEMTMVAALDGNRDVVHPQGWAHSPNPYSYGVASGDTLFMSGLVARSGKDNRAIGGDVHQQTTTILEQAGEILDAARMSFADVVNARVYLTDASSFSAMNDAYRPFVANPPARATVRTDLAGPGYLVEITMLAVKDPARRHVPFTEDGRAPATPLPLSAAVVAGGRAFLAGALGTDTSTANDPSAQTARMLERIGRTLQLAGQKWTDVRDAVVYLTDMRHREAVMRELASVVPLGASAGAVIETGLVDPNGLVEMMVTTG